MTYTGVLQILITLAAMIIAAVPLSKYLAIKQTEKAIRSCRMDPYCSQILTDKQVKYVAYCLNSLK